MEGEHVGEGLENWDTDSRVQILVPQGMSNMKSTHKYIQHHRAQSSDTGSLTFNSSEITNFSDLLVLTYTESLVILRESFYKLFFFF